MQEVYVLVLRTYQHTEPVTYVAGAATVRISVRLIARLRCLMIMRVTKRTKGSTHCGAHCGSPDCVHVGPGRPQIHGNLGADRDMVVRSRARYRSRSQARRLDLKSKA